jgi:zinc transport system ATP-binding protein
MSHLLATIRDLRVRLGGTDILNGVNADLERERITTLVGLNGSGKTTLLRALLEEVPFTGEIRFHCPHLRRPTPQHIGYVPQKLRIEGNLPLTVFDLFGLCLGRRPLFFGLNRTFRQRVLELLSVVNSSHLIDRPLEQISGGERQRVMLSLAIEPNPELLLLDEPAAGIDFHSQEGFYDLIARLNRERRLTVLLVSHDLSMVSKVAHHVWCLRDGVIDCQGSPEEALTREALGRTFGKESTPYRHHGHGHP